MKYDLKIRFWSHREKLTNNYPNVVFGKCLNGDSGVISNLDMTPDYNDICLKTSGPAH
jgi:hypothetical protein